MTFSASRDGQKTAKSGHAHVNYAQHTGSNYPGVVLVGGKSAVDSRLAANKSHSVAVRRSKFLTV